MGLRTFTFDGVPSSDFGVFFTEATPYNAPERAVEMIDIPGRSGAYALDLGKFENIEVTYHAVVAGNNNSTFTERISNLRNFLCSRVGYCRLSDDYNPGEYRMATYRSGLETDGVYNNGAEFDIVFDCKPQRYLAIGEEVVTIGAWGNTTTLEGDVVQLDALATDKVKSLKAQINPIQNLNGYDKPWVVGAGSNKWDEEWEVGYIDPNTGQNSTQYSTMIRSKNYIPCSPNTAYFFKASANASNGMFFYDSSKNYISKDFPSKDTAFTTPNNAYYIRFCMAVAYGTTYKNDIAINYPSTVTTYSPYENLCPISGSASVTVYGSGKNLIKVSSSSYNNSQACTYEITDSGVTVTATGNYARRMDLFNIVEGETYTVSFKAKSTGNNNTIYFCKSAEWNNRYGSKTATSTETAYAFTFTAETSQFALGWYVTSNSSSGVMTITDLQLELNSSPTTYEPYNGTTTTTSLGTTVYGGTLDVVSGVLTVTHGYKDLGDLSWTMSTSGTYNRFYSNGIASTVKIPNDGTGVAYLMNSAGYTPVGFYAAQAATTNFVTAITGNDISSRGNLNIVDNRFSDATSFQNGVSGYQVVYELATPTTTTLTPQQVELLVGGNVIFSDVGMITLEYGQDPAVLINPTMFESEPLLAVEGYGDVSFNNYRVSIDNATIGDVSQLVNESKYASMSTTFDNAMFNVGDTITVNMNNFTNGITLIMSGSTTPTTSGTVTDSDSHFTTVVTSCTKDQYITPAPVYGYIKTTCTPITFSIGTPATVTNNVEAVLTTQGDKGKWKQTVKYEIDGNGNHKITISHSVVGGTGSNVQAYTGGNAMPMISTTSVVATSTLSILGNPTYIDCDLGECYMIKDDTPISLNEYIDLGSDLPKLSSGANEFTTDNTITDLKVTPRYWKV